MNIYYVYGIYINDAIVYIGKGCGDRKDHHLRNFINKNSAVNRILNCKLQNAIKNNYVYRVSIINNKLTEQQALLRESELIKHYGRIIDNTGPLCNVCDGGNQPPSAREIKKLVGDLEWKSIRSKQKQTAQITIKNKIQDKLLIVEELLKSQKTIKEIAHVINVNKDTVLRWIIKYQIQGYTKQGKKIVIKDHLKKQREKNKGKIQKTSYIYTIVEPNGNMTQTANLITYCRQKGIDYSNLRQTIRKTSMGKQSKHKGYYIHRQSLQA
jgi:hypothetical protein